MDDPRQPCQRADVDIDEELGAGDIDPDAPRAFDRASDGIDRPAQHGFPQDEPCQYDHEKERQGGPGNRIEIPGLCRPSRQHPAREIPHRRWQVRDTLRPDEGQQEAAENRQRAKCHDQRRQAEIRDEKAVDRPQYRSETDRDKEDQRPRRLWPDGKEKHRRGIHRKNRYGGKTDVDATGDQHQHAAHGEDADDNGGTEQIGDGGDREEPRVRDRGDDAETHDDSSHQRFVAGPEIAGEPAVHDASRPVNSSSVAVRPSRASMMRPSRITRIS